MAQKRNRDSKKQVDTGRVITTPSAYGSHASMVVSSFGDSIGDSEFSVMIADDECVCRDDNGLYVTKRNRLDNGLGDPNRYGNPGARIGA